MALPKPTTKVQKSAVQFGIDLLTKYGYGYSVKVPVHQLERELKNKGCEISFMTILKYWRTLVEMKYATKEMQCRMDGATYNLNRYIFNKLIDAQ